jgi:hypothetical protein
VTVDIVNNGFEERSPLPHGATNVATESAPRDGSTRRAGTRISSAVEGTLQPQLPAVLMQVQRHADLALQRDRGCRASGAVFWRVNEGRSPLLGSWRSSGQRRATDGGCRCRLYRLRGVDNLVE